jgi:hypothetical protein
MSALPADRTFGLAALAALTATCVAYDPSGPAVPSVDGVWQASIAIVFENQLELLADTLHGELTLQDTHYRGRFSGNYRINVETGAFGGVIRPESTLIVNEFGPPPKPLAGVDTLRRLYQWCDFTRLGTGGLVGRLHGDTLSAEGQASLPCFYSLFGGQVEIATNLDIRTRAVR